jgi:tripartite-type tricarboxylate transporter receptor subunit TctC
LQKIDCAYGSELGADRRAPVQPASSRSPAQPGDYPAPNASLRYVVPFPPGGLTDVMARQVGQQLAERLKGSGRD